MCAVALIENVHPIGSRCRIGANLSKQPENVREAWYVDMNYALRSETVA